MMGDVCGRVHRRFWRSGEAESAAGMAEEREEGANKVTGESQINE